MAEHRPDGQGKRLEAVFSNTNQYGHTSFRVGGHFFSVPLGPAGEPSFHQKADALAWFPTQPDSGC